MMEDIKVSIVIAVYNTEKYLKKCLDSIRNQTYMNLEVIMVNDGSTDNSIDILQKYEKEDNRFKLYEQSNQGPGAAKNMGLTQSTGDYLIFIDSDDWIDKDFIEKCVEKASINNADIIYCDYIKETQDGQIIKYGKLSNYSNETLENIVKLNMTEKIPCGASKKMIKRSIIKKSNACFSDVVAGEELQYTLRSVIAAKSIEFSSDSYYHYVQRAGSQSKKHCDYTNNISVLENELKLNNLMEKYIDIFQTKIVCCIILEIFNCADTNKNIITAIMECKKLIRKYKEIYGDNYKGKYVNMYYADNRIKKVYPFFKLNLIFSIIILSKLYVFIKKLKTK